MFKNVKNSYAAAAVLLMFSLFLPKASAREEARVVPMGEAVGVKLYTDGLLIVGVSDNSSAKESGIKVGDVIKNVGGAEVSSSEGLCEIVNRCGGALTLGIERGGEEITVCAEPERDSDGVYKLGLWVRDSTAGIGTLTYYNPENNTFAALGHGINDVDTGNILTVKSGNILPCRILSVRKSENGNPGELNGSFDGSPIGEIRLNSDNGLYGSANISVSADTEAIPVADADEVTEGEAYILADIDGSGAKKYDIEIIKVSRNNKSHKDMVISVTDKTLLSVTGGIVQGMSGAPIIQNGKLAGALTHVFVNDSDKGYGAFAEDMLKVSEALG